MGCTGKLRLLYIDAPPDLKVSQFLRNWFSINGGIRTGEMASQPLELHTIPGILIWSNVY